MLHNPQSRVRALAEALPYLQRFRNKLVVVKYGGSAMVADNLKRGFARDVVLLENVGIHPIVVHGGGPRISARLEQAGLASRFVEGIRITDDAVLAEAQQALAEVNAELCQAVGDFGGAAAACADGALLRVRRMEPLGPERVSPGRVGVVEAVSPQLAELARRNGVVPALAPLGLDGDGLLCNINADLAAEMIAAQLGAEKVIFMTDAPGVMDAQGALVEACTRADMQRLIEQGVISGGMLPKVRCAFDAVRAGVKAAHIIDGRVEHALLLELLTDAGVGTLITG